jgi:hypothetical protein
MHPSKLIIPSTKDQTISPTKDVDDKSKKRLSRQLTKSVFPLFFDVL